MPTYAILGATGETGSAVLRHLATRPASSVTLHLLVRSKKKLFSLHPYLLNQSNIAIFEGAISDGVALANCLQSASVTFSCVAVNESMPGQRIALDTAEAIVSAIQAIQEDAQKDYRAPTVVMLSSASVNPILSEDAPKLFKSFLYTALSYLYDDLRQAEAFYKLPAHHDLLKIIFAQPPAIMSGDIPTGYELSLTRTTRVFSYADLGVGMVKMAERGDEFVEKGVSVNATGKVREDWRPNLRALFSGLVAHFFPGVWSAGRRRGWWWCSLCSSIKN